MKERPILFSTEMVRAILDGRKTQTRRVIKPQPVKDEHGFWTLYGAGWSMNYGPVSCMPSHSLSTQNPYGEPGDLLWVRETWAIVSVPDWTTARRIVGVYKADNPQGLLFPSKWKPSIHMPKARARLWLRVKNVRVERVQDISENDAWAEGVGDGQLGRFDISGRVLFKSLWNSINEKRGYGWDANPWVWVVEFEIVENYESGGE